MLSKRLDTWDTVCTKMTSWIPEDVFWVLMPHLFIFLLGFVLHGSLLASALTSHHLHGDGRWYPKHMISPSNYAKERGPKGALGTEESPWDWNSPPDVCEVGHLGEDGPVLQL